MLVTKFKYVIFLFASVVFWDSIFFFRSIPDIIVAYCIYVDMKVIAMKAKIRSSNNDQIYGKVHVYMNYVYQIIILYKAFCVTVSTNFDTYIWGLEIEIYLM